MFAQFNVWKVGGSISERDKYLNLSKCFFTKYLMLELVPVPVHVETLVQYTTDIRHCGNVL